MTATDDAKLLMKKLRSKGCEPNKVIADGQIVLWAVSMDLDGIRLDEAWSSAVADGWLCIEENDPGHSRLTLLGYESGRD